MTAIPILIVGYLLIYLLMRFFRFISQCIRTKSWRHWTAKGTALAAIPFALIAATEYLSPSIYLTGYRRPLAPELHWQLPETDWTKARLTYAQAAKLAPWLSHLGDTTRDEFEATLKQAQENLRAPIASNQRLTAKYNFFLGEDLEVKYDALNVAIDGLDERFKDGSIPTLEAWVWLAGINVDVATKKQLEMVQGFSEALLAFQLYSVDHDSENLTPEGAVLSSAVRRARNQQYQAQRALDTAEKRFNIISEVFTKYDSEAEFPALPGPIEIEITSDPKTTSAYTSRFEDYLLIGPAVTGNWAGRIISAFNHDNRLPKKVGQDIRCFVAIVDAAQGPEHETACEIHVPVRINYDLTAGNCPTPSNAQSCTERWILPDLTLVVRDSGLTVFPPIPALAPDNEHQIRASTWEVSYNGETKTLDGETKFEVRSSQAFDLSDVHIRHIPRQDAGPVRIWQDFERAAFITPESTLLTGQEFEQEHAFAGHQVSLNSIDTSIFEQLWPEGYGAADNDNVRKYVKEALNRVTSISRNTCNGMSDDADLREKFEWSCDILQENFKFLPLALANLNGLLD